MVTSCNKTVTPPDEEILGEQAPIEEQMPTEEQTPVEEQEKQNENIETDLENYVKIIIEKDGVEKEHLILLDEAELQSSYVPTELVPRDQFNFGEYALFVKIPTEVYSRHRTPIYSYAFITSNTSNSSEALNEYEGFNERYLIQEAIPDGEFGGIYLNQPQENEYNEFLSNEFHKFLSKSKVVYVSEEGDVIGRHRLTDGGSWVNESYEKDNDLNGRVWNSVYDILDTSGQTLVFFEQKNVSQQDIPGFDELFHLHRHSSNRKFYFYVEYHSDYSSTNDEYTVYTTKYGLPTEDVIMKVTLISDTNCRVEDYNGSNKLVLGVSENEKSHLLVYDFDTNETIILEHINHYLWRSGTYNATLSPDGAYLAYTPQLYTEDGNFYTKKQGFYIKEIETGKTVFYDFSKEIDFFNNEYDILGWVRESKLQ